MDSKDDGYGGDRGGRSRYALRTGRNETPLERDDRNFAELLQELRVTQMGVQILFAFLLGLAFTPRFPEITDVQKSIYIVTLLLSVVASALLTAPAALHRMLFRRHAKRKVVDVSSKLAGLGLVVLALALTGSVLLIVDVVLGRLAGLAACTGTLVIFALLWAVLPWLVRRSRNNDILG